MSEICPVCSNTMHDSHCSVCSYEQSADFLKYPTFISDDQMLTRLFADLQAGLKDRPDELIAKAESHLAEAVSLFEQAHDAGQQDFDVIINSIKELVCEDELILKKGTNLKANDKSELLLELAELRQNHAMYLFEKAKSLGNKTAAAKHFAYKSTGESFGDYEVKQVIADSPIAIKPDDKENKAAADALFDKGLNAYLGISSDLNDGESAREHAIPLFQEALAMGNTFSATLLGDCYETGIGIEPDYAEAMKWYRRAAELGEISAYYNIGCLYENGKGVEKNLSTAVEYYSLGAELDMPLCQNALGRCCASDTERDRSSEAFEWFRKAADRGNDDAKYNLGKCYYDGYGVEADKATAVKWFALAAEQSHAAANYMLGLCYETACGTSMDIGKALICYKAAADKGDSDAQLSLYRFYKYGIEVEKDTSAAMLWLKKSAEGGNTDAQLTLAKKYETGTDVNQNYDDAEKWYRAAADKGNLEAGQALEMLKSIKEDDSSSEDPTSDTEEKASFGEIDVPRFNTFDDVAAFLEKHKDYLYNNCNYLVPGSLYYSHKSWKIKDAFADFDTDERPLLLCDFSVFGSLNDAFILTDKSIYRSRSILRDSKRYDLRDLLDIKQVQYDFSSAIWLYFKKSGSESRTDIIKVFSSDAFYVASAPGMIAAFWERIKDMVAENNSSLS